MTSNASLMVLPDRWDERRLVEEPGLKVVRRFPVAQLPVRSVRLRNMSGDMPKPLEGSSEHRIGARRSAPSPAPELSVVAADSPSCALFFMALTSFLFALHDNTTTS